MGQWAPIHPVWALAAIHPRWGNRLTVIKMRPQEVNRQLHTHALDGKGMVFPQMENQELAIHMHQCYKN